MLYIGIDLGGTNIKAALVDAQGRVLAETSAPTGGVRPPRELCADIAALAFAVARQANCPWQDVAALGLGCPGTVDDRAGVVVYANNLEWRNFAAAACLRELTGRPVALGNDANVAALAESLYGCARGAHSAVIITLGTGVGGGIVVDGKLLAGVHGAGGEIGHIKVVEGSDRVCGCGKTGCLEQYASATGIVKSAKELLADPEVETALRQHDPLTCKDIFDCAAKGDKAAIQLTDEMCRLLGKALASVSCVCDPEVIVVGGGVARAGQPLLDGIQKAFRQYAFPAAEDTAFALASLGNDAGICGGVQMILTK